MHRILTVFLAITAFLGICLYWGWQVLTGRPALNIETILLRATGGMLAVFVIGWFLSRVSVSVISETWQETQARNRDREMARKMAVSEISALSDAASEGEEPSGRVQGE